jgi:putative MATE family efflux protein
MILAFSAVCTAVPYFVMEPVLRFSGASDVTLPYAKEYLSVYLVGTVFVLISLGLNQFISAQGHPGVAMLSVVIGALLNTVLDPIFIFGFGMGIRGAAVATVMSQAASAAWVLSFLFGKRAGVGLSLGVMRLHLPTVGKICALGVSPFVMASTESVVGFALNGQLSAYGGDIHVSALAIMQGAMQAVSVPLAGFSQGVVPILSYNYGHKLNDRVKECFKICAVILFTFNLFGMLFMIIFPSVIAGAFTDDGELLSVVCKYMPLFLTGMTIFGLQRTCQNTFVALGQAKISLFIALLRKVILLVPLAYIFPSLIGVSGVYLAEAVADATAAISCTTIFAFLFPRILKKNAGAK